MFKKLSLSFLALAPVAAFATSDYDAITTAVSFTGVTVAMGIVAAALAGLLVFRKGAKIILGMIK